LSKRSTLRERTACHRTLSYGFAIQADGIEVEFNPREVAAYRLIGYENRLLRNES
jgi:hypothetical protein